MPDFDKTKLHRLVIGGEPVGFTKSTGTLHLAGSDLTLKDWQELERRINLLFHRAGYLSMKFGRADSNSGSSSFLTNNLKQILKRDSGVIKNPPWWLRWLYSGVITKEETQ